MSITQQLAELNAGIEQISASDRYDSLGNPKSNVRLPGPGKADSAPPDAFTSEETAARTKQADAKRIGKMASTADVDSRGAPKGAFQVTPQGHDKNGMRLPDKVDYSKPLEAAPKHGPRGPNAPKDSYQT